MGVITVDVSEMTAWKKKIDTLSTVGKEQFFRTTLNELAGKFFALVVPRTPAKSGTLRKGWAIQPVTSSASTYEVEVKNDTDYASYVEYGHRQTPGRFVPELGKRLKASWVNGQFFMQGAEDDLKKVAPQTIQKNLTLFLKGVF